MIDLISRKAAIEAIGERPYNWTDSEAEIAEVCAWESHKSAIENINAVDAVPVVRCAYCKHYEEEPYGDVMMCYRGLGYTRPSDYCSRGERRESE